MVCRLNRDVKDLKKKNIYLAEVYKNPDLVGAHAAKERELSQREKDIDEKLRQLSTYDPKPEWMSSMKPDQFVDYEVGTIQREASQRRSRNSGTSGADNAAFSKPDLYENTSKADQTHNGSLLHDEITMY